MTWLSKYTVSDLDLPTPLISLCHPDQTLFQAIDVLSERHLLSAPVLSSDGALLGILDALDIVAHTIQCATDGQEVFEDVPLNKVMGLAHDDPKFIEVGMDKTLDEVAAVISGSARRAVVIGADGKAHSVITQSALVQFMHSKLGEISELKTQWTAQDLCSPSPVCVPDTATALTAFRAISERHVSSVAIVDEENSSMVSVASATDLVVGLAHMTEKSQALKRLAEENIVDVIMGNRKLDHKARAATVTVKQEHTLDHILEKLARTRVHRVIVCAEDGKTPHGVLSLTDICRAAAAGGS